MFAFLEELNCNQFTKKLLHTEVLVKLPNPRVKRNKNLRLKRQNIYKELLLMTHSSTLSTLLPRVFILGRDYCLREDEQKCRGVKYNKHLNSVHLKVGRL